MAGKGRLAVWRGRAQQLAQIPHIMVVTAVLPVLIRLRPPQLAAFLELVPLGGRPNEAAIPLIQSHADRVSRLCAPVMKANCMTRGIVLFYFLRRAGIDVHLTFGAGMLNDSFAAHCWLERYGVPFLEPRDPRPSFPTFLRIPRDGTRAAALPHPG